MFRPRLDLDLDFPSLGTANPSPPTTSTRLSLAQSKSYAAASSTNPYGYYAGDPSRKLTRNDFPTSSTPSTSTSASASTNNSSSMVSPWHNGYPSSLLEQQQDSNALFYGDPVKYGGSKSSNEQSWVSRVGNTLKLTQPMQPPVLRRSAAATTAAQAAGTAAAAAAKSSQQAAIGNSDKSTHQAGYYGLLGLIDVIQRKNPDKSMLGLGTDLDTLGLDLNAPGEIYPSFLSPWSETNIQSQISQQTNSAIQYGFYLLASYRSIEEALLRPASSRMHVLSDEILFYTFYCMARDELQDAAAQELFERGWRYHKGLGLWITKEQGILEAPQQTSNPMGQGVFVFFDPNTWQKKQKEYTICWDAMEMKRETASFSASYASSAISSPAAGGTGSTTSTQL